MNETLMLLGKKAVGLLVQSCVLVAVLVGIIVVMQECGLIFICLCSAPSFKRDIAVQTALRAGVTKSEFLAKERAQGPVLRASDFTELLRRKRPAAVAEPGVDLRTARGNEYLVARVREDDGYLFVDFVVDDPPGARPTSRFTICFEDPAPVAAPRASTPTLP